MNYCGKVEFVYVAACKNKPNGPIKIGYTTDPRKRPYSALNRNHEILDFAYIKPLPIGIGKEYESRLFGHLNNYHLYGEWFNCSPETAVNKFKNNDWYFEEFLKKSLKVDEKCYSGLFDKKNLIFITNSLDTSAEIVYR